MPYSRPLASPPQPGRSERPVDYRTVWIFLEHRVPSASYLKPVHHSMAWTALEVGVQPTSLPLFLLIRLSRKYFYLLQTTFPLTTLQLTLSLIALGCNRKYRQDVFQSP